MPVLRTPWNLIKHTEESIAQYLGSASSLGSRGTTNRHLSELESDLEADTHLVKFLSWLHW